MVVKHEAARTGPKLLQVRQGLQGKRSGRGALAARRSGCRNKGGDVQTHEGRVDGRVPVPQHAQHERLLVRRERQQPRPDDLPATVIIPHGRRATAL